jgi:hypothetical protein
MVMLLGILLSLILVIPAVLVLSACMCFSQISQNDSTLKKQI